MTVYFRKEIERKLERSRYEEKEIDADVTEDVHMKGKSRKMFFYFKSENGRKEQDEIAWKHM